LGKAAQNVDCRAGKKEEKEEQSGKPHVPFREPFDTIVKPGNN